MTNCWSAASFCYYMLTVYVKYQPGNMYQNAISSGLAEMASSFTSGVFYQKFGLKRSITFMFVCATIGGTLILLFGE